jgi:hypothetical protein
VHPLVHAQLDDLDCHSSPDRFSLLGDIDHTSTFADFFQNLVAPNLLANGFVGSVRQLEFHRRFGSRRGFGEHASGLLVSREQSFQPCPQCFVVAAFPV